MRVPLSHNIAQRSEASDRAKLLVGKGRVVETERFQLLKLGQLLVGRRGQRQPAKRKMPQRGQAGQLAQPDGAHLARTEIEPLQLGEPGQVGERGVGDARIFERNDVQAGDRGQSGDARVAAAPGRKSGER